MTSPATASRGEEGPADIFISAVEAEASEAALALKDALIERGLSVLLSNGSEDGDEHELSGCGMAIILGTTTFGLSSKDAGNQTAKHLRFIISKRKPFFFVKMSDAFEAPEATFCLPDDAAHFRWTPEKSFGSLQVPAGLIDGIQREFKTQLVKESGTSGAAVYDLGGAEEELYSASRAYEQPKPSMLADPHGYDNIVGQTRNADSSRTQAGLHLRDDEECYETIIDARNDIEFPPINPQRDQVQKAWASLNNNTSESETRLPGRAQEGFEIPLRRLSSRNSVASKTQAPILPPRTSASVPAFGMSPKSISRGSAATGGLSIRALFVVVIIAFLVAAATVVVGILIYDSTAAGGTGGTGGSASSGQAGPNTTIDPGAAIPPPSGPCTASTTATLNCGDLTSRNDFTTSGACDAGAVVECCCDEFYKLQSVTASVTLFTIVDTLRFGAITNIGGDIIGRERQLKVVEFGRLARVEGNINLQQNSITSVDFGALTYVEGMISLTRNRLSRVDLGMVSSVGSIVLSRNSITRFDAQELLSTHGHLDLRQNPLTSLSAGSLTTVDGRLYLSGTRLNTVSLPSLTHVKERLSAANIDLAVLDLKSLTTAGGFHLSNNKLTSVDLSQLHTNMGIMDLRNNRLSSISLPSLTYTHDLRLGQNELLTSLDLGPLTTINGSLLLDGNRLSSVSLPSLTNVHSLNLGQNELTSLDLRSLTEVRFNLILDGNRLSNVSLPSLTDLRDLNLGQNELTSLDLRSLRTVRGNLILSDNHLSNVRLPLLSKVTGTLSLANNDLEAIDFGSLTAVYSLVLRNNRLTSIDLQSLKIGYRLDLRSNNLTLVDCHGLVDRCVCIDDGVAILNCPNKCYGC